LYRIHPHPGPDANACQEADGGGTRAVIGEGIPSVPSEDRESDGFRKIANFTANKPHAINTKTGRPLQANRRVSFRAIVFTMVCRVLHNAYWASRGTVVARAIKVIRIGWNIVEKLHRLRKISTIDPRSKNNPYIAVPMVYTAIDVSVLG
jgi:hypothetical protein